MHRMIYSVKYSVYAVCAKWFATLYTVLNYILIYIDKTQRLYSDTFNGALYFLMPNTRRRCTSHIGTGRAISARDRIQCQYGSTRSTGNV